MQRDRNPRWSKIKRGPFHRIGDAYSHFFNTEHFMGRTPFDDSWLAPKIPSNVKKTQQHYEIEMALPGFKKDEVNIMVDGDLLKVRAEKNPDKKKDFLTKEVHFDAVNRNFQLDADVNRDKIRAVLEDGLLKIALPHNGSHKPQLKRRIKVA